MIICEECGSNDEPNYGVKFDFSRKQYRCPEHHGGFTIAANLGIKRKLIGKQISYGTESHILDRTISPEDGQTLIHKSTGKPWKWQGE